jgi:choline-sulfatase
MTAAPVSRRRFLGSMAAAPAALAAQSATGRKPNVVFFMTDDHGAWSLGAYGCKDMHTPNLDRLAERGVLFERAFAATPVCSPSRATYYTGKLPSHHGVADFLLAEDSDGPDSRAFLAEQTTFAEILKREGYTCGLVGKWHLGRDREAQAGFDHWVVGPGGAGTFRNKEFFVNGDSVKETGFKTDFVGTMAAEFVEANRDRPFCLVVPFFAPHDPFDYQPEEYRKHYYDSSLSCYPEPPLHPQRRGRHDKYLSNRESKISYSALVSAVDANVGRVLAKLDEHGLTENTVVIFTADQGYNCGHHGFWGKGNGTIPFNMYEESIRVPLIWSHPGRISEGRRVSPMVSSYDFFPTLLDYLGVKAPPDPQRVGRSYAAFLRGESPAWPTELYFEFAYVRSIRTENLKLVERADGWPDELFDLEDDPDEQINRIGFGDYPKQAAELRGRLHRYFDRIGAPPIAEWRTTTKQRLPIDEPGYYRWKE